MTSPIFVTDGGGVRKRVEERRESVIEERARASDSQAGNELTAGHAQFVQNESRDQRGPIETHATVRQDAVLGRDQEGAERGDAVELLEVR